MKSGSVRLAAVVLTVIVMASLARAAGLQTYDTTVLEDRSNMWSRIWGSPQADTGKRTTVDAAGNVYVAGDTLGAFDGQTNAGDRDLCLTKYAADGTKIWTRIWGSINADSGMGVALDRATNVYVAGYAGGAFDDQMSVGDDDLCLTKFTVDGAKIWSRIWGSTNQDIGTGMAVDDLTNVYVSGYTRGEFDSQTNAGNIDLCLTKFDADGTRQWSRIWGSTQLDSSADVALYTPSSSYLGVETGGLRAASNIYVAGYTAGAFDGQTNAGVYNQCLTKWAADGAKVWSRIWGSTNVDFGWGLAVDYSGNAYVTGDTMGSFGDQTNNGGYDICLTKINSGGTQIWARIWGSVTDDLARAVAVDQAGNPCVAGTTTGAYDGQANAGGYDLCLSKLNTGGARAWTRIWGSTSNDIGQGIALNGVGHIFVAGYTAGAFDGQTNAGSTDLCLTKWGFTAPGAAPGVNASDGTYTYKVLVSWGAATNAFGYRVWRNTVNDSASAEELGGTTSTAYYDSLVEPGLTYYYWVKTTNDVGVSEFSSPDSGWRRSQASTDNAPSDLDGDHKKDPLLYQENTGEWAVMFSASQYQAQQLMGFGGAGCRAVSGDYDGDSKSDPAIYQPAVGLWTVMLSDNHYASVSLSDYGGPSYTPVPADYDGDGKTDPAIYEESTGTWIVRLTRNSYAPVTVNSFGGPGYRPLFGDFDADGKDDLGVYSDATGLWMVRLSGAGYGQVEIAGFGVVGCQSLHGDFDADRKADPALYHEPTGTWLVMLSASSYASVIVTDFGGSGYTPVSGDFDFDYKADLAVYQRATGNWQIMLSGNHYQSALIQGFGGAGYMPVP